MTNEIKEILSLLKSSSWCNEANQIEDYITNLQENYDKQVDYIGDLVTEKVKLQEENQALKNQLDFIKEQNHIIDKLEKENKIIKSQLNICSQDLYMENLRLKQENEELKEHIEILTSDDEDDEDDAVWLEEYNM